MPEPGPATYWHIAGGLASVEPDHVPAKGNLYPRPGRLPVCVIYLKMVIKDVRYFENVGSAGPALRLRVFARLLFQWLERAL